MKSFFVKNKLFVNEKDEKRCSRLGAGPNYIIIFIRWKKAKKIERKKWNPKDPITSKKKEEQNIQKWRRRLVVNKD